MSQRPIDVLTPFMNADANRSETFLVPLSGFLYNRTAAFVNNMLSDPERWLGIFPGLSMFYDMTALQIYKATMYYNVIDLFTSIMDPKLLEEERFDLIVNAIETLEQEDLRNNMITPLTAYALSQIASERCCEKIMISKRNQFTKYEEEYLLSLFDKNREKIEMVSGDFFSIWEENKTKFTTIFIEELSSINPFESYVKETKFDTNKQMFLLRINSKIIDKDEGTGMYKYNCTDRLNELNAMKIHVGTISSDPYPVIDNNVPVRSSKK